VISLWAQLEEMSGDTPPQAVVHRVRLDAGARFEVSAGAPFVDMTRDSRFPRSQLDTIEVWDGERYLAGRLTLLT
jgi:hypothetical protein